jgi:S1-C subfamily serine protease
MGKRASRFVGLLTGVITGCFAFVGAAVPTTPASIDYLPIAKRDGQALLRQVTQRVMSFGCAASKNGTAVNLTDGTLVTAAHVVAGTRLINVVPDLGPTTIATAQVAPNVDLAVLHEARSATTRGLVLAPDDPAPGTTVLLAGYPHGQLSLVIGEAVVTGWTDGRAIGQAGGPFLTLRHSATTGMSGGPLLDPAGRLAGIVVATRTGAAETFAIPASVIRATLAAGAAQPAPGC